MIVGRHPDDGRIVLMARDESLKPMIRSADGKWGPAKISGRELDEFEDIDDEAECQALLEEAKAAAGPELRLRSEPEKVIAAVIAKRKTARQLRLQQVASGKKRAPRKETSESASERATDIDRLVKRIKADARSSAAKLVLPREPVLIDDMSFNLRLSGGKILVERVAQRASVVLTVSDARHGELARQVRERLRKQGIRKYKGHQIVVVDKVTTTSGKREAGKVGVRPSSKLTS